MHHIVQMPVYHSQDAIKENQLVDYESVMYFS